MPAVTQLRLSEVIAALSAALDLTEGQPTGHAARSCLIGMRLAESLDLPADQRSALFYALLLKDAGCSSNAGRLASLFKADDILLKREHKLIDWTRLGPAFDYTLRLAEPEGSLVGRARRVLVIALKKEEVGRGMMEIRCERGAEIIRMLGLPEATAEAVRNLDEHWDGLGHPKGLKGEDIPLLGRILCLAQTTDVFYCAYGLEAVTTMLMKRRGLWFDPKLVTLLAESLGDREFWEKIRGDDVVEQTAAYEPPDRVYEASEERIDTVARVFARVIDAKSPYTSQHSERVAARCVAMGQQLGLLSEELRDLKLAGLLHDVGMLGVSNLILEKKEPLTGEEWESVRRHPQLTRDILRRVTPFHEVAEIAACHHEHLDGTGYPRGLTAEQLSMPARILALATRAEALLADRAHGKGVPWNEMLAWLAPLAGRVVDQRCYDALCALSAAR